MSVEYDYELEWELYKQIDIMWNHLAVEWSGRADWKLWNGLATWLFEVSATEERRELFKGYAIDVTVSMQNRFEYMRGLIEEKAWSADKKILWLLHDYINLILEKEFA